MTKPILVPLCLLAGMLLCSSSRAQESNEQKPAAQGEQKPAAEGEQKAAAQKKEAVPEKVVSEDEAIKQLVGSYRIVSGEKSGEQILPERLAEVTVRITEKTITTYDGDRQQRFSATYRLDTAQRPWRIRMIPVPITNTSTAGQNTARANANTSPSDGLIEVTEKGVKVVYALPGGGMPRSFKAAAHQQLFVLERLKDPADAAATAAPTSANASEGTKSDK